MNDAVSLERMHVLPSARPVAKAVARVASSVRSPGITSSSGMTATGLKKWNPTTRSGCSSRLAISVIESDEVFVMRTHSAETTASTSANTCCLTDISSKTASMTRSASAKPSLDVEPVTRRVRNEAVSGETRRFSRRPCDLVVDPADALGHALLVEVGHDDRHPEAAREEQGELAGHEAGADDADLGHRSGEGLVRRAGRALGPLLHEVEGVEAGPQLVGHDEVGERLVLGGEGVLAGRGARGPDQLDGAQRTGGAAGGLGPHDLRGPVAGGVPGVRVAVDLGAVHRHGTAEHPGGPAQGVLEEVGGLEQDVGDAELRRPPWP